MNVTLKQVRAFVAIAQSRSFAEAAASIHLSQPALSSAIKNLEETVGGQLLVRTTRTFALTPEGEAFLPVAQRLLNEWDDALEDLNNRFALRYGKISIAAMPSFASNLLPLAMREYRNHYPEVRITLHDVIAEEVVSMVRQGRVELGISFDPGDSEDLSFTPLFEDRFIAVLPGNHPLLAYDQVDAKSLMASDFITLQQSSRLRQLIRERVSEQGLTFNPAFEAHQLATIGRMVANGLGVSIVPALCEQQMQELGAHCRPLIEPEIQQQVGLITRRRYPLSAACQAMAGVLEKTFSK
jgi:LysR family carnitine catabolism transcriptional activator